MKGKVFRIVLIILVLLIAAFSALQIIRHYSEEKEADGLYSDLLEYAVVPEETEPEETTGVSPNETAEHTPEETTTPEVIDVPPAIDFIALQEKYPDVIGWIYSPDTPINYPIVCGKDNNQYLRHLPDGSYNTTGSIFLDYRCGEIGENRNTVIYGHNMKNGTMFSSLTKYKSQAYYDEHPWLYLLTPDGNYRIELYAGAVVKASSGIYETSPGNEAFADVLAEIKGKSTFHSEMDVDWSDNIVTLSTCSYEFDNARYVVVGKLILI